MKKERGFIMPDLVKVAMVLIAAAVLVGAIAGAIGLVTSYLDGVRKEAKQAGKDECDAAYKARDLKQVNDLKDEILRLYKEKEAAEARASMLAKQLGAKVKLEKENADKAKDAVLNDVSSGALVLRDGVVLAVACPADDGGEAAGAVAGRPAGGVGKTCYQLADDATRRIVAAAARADSYAIQINAALKMLEDDRASCNAP